MSAAARMEAFKLQYADPPFRLPMAFAEIFPVGVLASALLPRNPRACRRGDKPRGIRVNSSIPEPSSFARLPCGRTTARSSP